jgi:hypothetical protein
MINKILTGITLNNYDPSLSLFYNINDTFFPSEKLSFTCPLATLNSLLSLSINSGNISSYKLYVRISSDVSGSTINSILFEETISLTASNITNNSFIVSIRDIIANISHDYLCDTMSTDEIFNLYKNFKIIFRVFTGSLSDKFTILATDIIQDLNIVLNTAETGPYNVKLHEMDLVDPQIFSEEEQFDIYKEHRHFLSYERVRIFYPENAPNTNKCPLILFSHGNGQYTSGYDLYLSDLASYGYICASVTINPDNNESQSQLLIELIDYFNNYLNRLNINISNKINLSKINLGGHSRGGAVAIHAAQKIQNKEYIFKVKNKQVDINNIKSLILFADAANGSCYYQNIHTTVDAIYISAAEISYPSHPKTTITENDLKYFDMFINIPIFNLQGQQDSDSSISDVVYGYGFSWDIKRNIPEILNIVPENLLHGELQSFSKFSRFDYNSHASVYLTGNPRWAMDESRFVYNTNLPKLNDCKSELILFLGRHNFNSSKIKKLNYKDTNLNDKKIYKQNKKLISKNIKENYSQIKYILDSFNGITLSYAGATGLTFTNIGVTYDFAVDKAVAETMLIARGFTEQRVQSYIDAVYQNRIKLEALPTDYTQDFAGIIGFNYRGLYSPIESNFLMGYTYPNSLTFSENNYLVLNGSLKLMEPLSSGNTMEANFHLTLIDGSNNTATVSSKINGSGFKPPFNVYKFGTVDYDASEVSSQPTYHTNIYFRAGDFYLTNPSINLNNINQILLSFGPDYGSTMAHICFDEFIVLKEI